MHRAQFFRDRRWSERAIRLLHAMQARRSANSAGFHGYQPGGLDVEAIALEDLEHTGAIEYYADHAVVSELSSSKSSVR